MDVKVPMMAERMDGMVSTKAERMVAKTAERKGGTDWRMGF